MIKDAFWGDAVQKVACARASCVRWRWRHSLIMGFRAYYAFSTRLGPGGRGGCGGREESINETATRRPTPDECPTANRPRSGNSRLTYVHPSTVTRNPGCFFQLPTSCRACEIEPALRKGGKARTSAPPSLPVAKSYRKCDGRVRASKKCWIRVYLR